MDGFYQWGADPRVWRRVVEVDLTRQRDDEYAVETGALGARAIRLDVDNRMSDDLILRLESEIARLTSSRFWGVSWDQRNRKWQARYLDADGKYRCIGRFDNDEVAAYVVNEAIRDAGLEGKRRTNPVDATGALVPRKCTLRKSAAAAARAPALSQKAPAVDALATAARARDRSAAFAPDAARTAAAPSEAPAAPATVGDLKHIFGAAAAPVRDDAPPPEAGAPAAPPVVAPVAPPVADATAAPATVGDLKRIFGRRVNGLQK